MTISIYGAFRSNTTMTDNLATYATVNGTFQINSYSQLIFQDGADGTVIDGDSTTNESPNDTTQTLNGNAILWDYTITVTDGTTNYEIGVLDHDLNGNGSMGYPTAEQGYFLAFIGSLPPLSTTLTISTISNNGVSIPVSSVVPCFNRGTMISTPGGPVAIENLQVGDAVLTLDRGAKPILWVGSRKLSQIELMAYSKFRPIRVASGALGSGLPERDLIVSPQHRMLLRSVIAQRMFGSAEIFVPAKKLIGVPGITVDFELQRVEYFHLLFDRHEVVFAEGAPTESLFTGPEALKGVGAAARAEIAALFPELETAAHAPVLARNTPETGARLKQLVARHRKNNKSILADACGMRLPEVLDLPAAANAI